MSPPLSARYRTAFVTGASTGLGRAFCDLLLREGVLVWGTSRSAARLAPQPNFHAIELDLADGGAVEDRFRREEQAAGGFDLVINNAGFGAFGSFPGTDFNVWAEQLQVMLVNTARLSHLALNGMLARRHGALVNVSSLAAEFALPYQPAYNMVKSGLSALNESLMYELRGTGVIVVDLRPGDYRTDFEGSVRRPAQSGPAAAEASIQRGMQRTWQAFSQLMQGGPAPEHAAQALRRALLRGRSDTVRCGRFFQAVAGPLLARLGSLRLRRRIQEKYFGL